MSGEQENKAIIGRWFQEFRGNPWNPKIIDELAAPDILLQYSLPAPRRGHNDVRDFMMGFREAFPDLNFWGTADLIAEGEYVVGRWEGGGTHTGPAFHDFLIGSHCRRAPGGRCDLPGPPFFGSGTAKLQKRWGWTTARPLCNNSAF